MVTSVRVFLFNFLNLRMNIRISSYFLLQISKFNKMWHTLFKFLIKHPWLYYITSLYIAFCIYKDMLLLNPNGMECKFEYSIEWKTWLNYVQDHCLSLQTKSRYLDLEVVKSNIHELFYAQTQNNFTMFLFHCYLITSYLLYSIWFYLF